MSVNAVFSTPVFFVLLFAAYGILAFELYHTPSQIPLRPKEKRQLRCWSIGMSFGSALLFSLIYGLLQPDHWTDAFLYNLSQPVWAALGLLGSILFMAAKVRYSPRVLWSFYGRAAGTLVLLLVPAAAAQTNSQAVEVLVMTCAVGLALLRAGWRYAAENSGSTQDGYNDFSALRISSLLSCSVLSGVCWSSCILFQLAAEKLSFAALLNLICFAALLVLEAALFAGKKKEKPVVLFDLDGTLIDSQPLVFETFRRVFQQKLPEHVLSENELYSFFGPTLEVTFGKYFPAEEVEEVIELYQKINLALHDEMVRPMEGAGELLRSLKEAGYKVGIVSNKRTHVVKRGAECCKLAEYADLIYGKEDLGEAKPNPEGLIRAVEALDGRRDNIIYAGDNPTDIRAARNMGAWSMGYTTDPRQRKALEESAPDFLADHLRDLEVLLVEKTF